MSSTADTEEVVETTADGVTVRKSFTADEFPVPTIRFEIDSEYEQPVSIRLSESIPESFPMDSVGFHPEYHSDNWTAFQDNHIEFSGTIEPDDPLVTVYGVRIDAEEATTFLTEPSIVDVDVEGDPESDSDATEIDDTMIDDIVSEDRNQVVKEMLSGDSGAIPGLDGESDRADEEDLETAESGEAIADVDGGSDGLDLNLEDVDTEPIEADEEEGEGEDAGPELDIDFGEPESDGGDSEGGDEASGDQSESGGESDDGPKIELDLDAASEAVSSDGSGPDPEETPESEETTDAGGADPDDESASSSTDEDAVDWTARDEASGGDDDSEPSETESESSSESDDGAESDDVSLSYEDETVEDTADSAPSIADEPVGGATDESSVGAALATEIREGRIDDDDLAVLRDELEIEPSGADLAKVEHLQSRVEEVAAYASAMEEFLEEEGTGAQLIEDVTDELAALESDVDSLADGLDETDAAVETLGSDLDALEERTAATEADVDRIDDDLADVSDEVAAVDDHVDDLETDLETVDESLEGVEDDVADLDENLAELDEDVDDLEDDLESVRDDVTDIQEWRDQLGSMFSG